MPRRVGSELADTRGHPRGRAGSGDGRRRTARGAWRQTAATPALAETAHALIDDGDSRRRCSSPSKRDEIVGVLGVSWQIAMRIPGRYGLIQELWVQP